MIDALFTMMVMSAGAVIGAMAICLPAYWIGCRMVDRMYRR